jgi:hypothetical protein
MMDRIFRWNGNKYFRNGGRAFVTSVTYFESQFSVMPLIEQNQSFELSRDINPEITKGMMGVIVEILEPDNTFEVEFPREDGGSYGDKSFTITIEDILMESLQTGG